MQQAPSELHHRLREAADAGLQAPSACPCSAAAFREALGLAAWEGPQCTAGQRKAAQDSGSLREHCSVPLLDTMLLQQGHGSELFTDGRLVRMRCMVQDVRQAEYFSKRIVLNPSTGDVNGNVPVTLSGFWRDSIPMEMTRGYDMERPQATAANTAERLILHCVPIPGETEWVMEQRKAALGENMLSKRGSSALSQECDKDRNVAGANSRKKESGRKGITTIVKVHEFRDLAFKLNDVIEFVGVLNLPTAADMGPDGSPMDCDEEEGVLFPGSLPEDGTFDEHQLPRLHALAWRPLGRSAVSLRSPDGTFSHVLAEALTREEPLSFMISVVTPSP